MKEIILKKGEILQRSEQTNTKVYIVKSGLLRSYSIDKNGKEHVFMFAPEGWVIADSCPPESKSVLFIDALEDSVVTAFNKNLEREKQNLTALTKRLNALQKRVLILLSSNTLEKYERFIEQYPGIVQRVPQRMIASYIGVNPETLSSVKSKFLKKD